MSIAKQHKVKREVAIPLTVKISLDQYEKSDLSIRKSLRTCEVVNKCCEDTGHKRGKTVPQR